MTEQYSTSTASSLSAAQSSSLGRSTHDAVIQQESTLPKTVLAQPASNSFNYEAWIIPVIGMALTGVIGYYSSMMSLKEEISSNREGVSVLENDMTHVKSNLARVERETKNGDNAFMQSELLDVKLENLKSRFVEHVANTKEKHNK